MYSDMLLGQKRIPDILFYFALLFGQCNPIALLSSIFMSIYNSCLFITVSVYESGVINKAGKCINSEEIILCQKHSKVKCLETRIKSIILSSAASQKCVFSRAVV